MLKGGLLMKQYYQFMLHEVLDQLDGTDCNMDAFEEDLHKMLMVSPPGGCECVRERAEREHVRVNTGAGGGSLQPDLVISYWIKLVSPKSAF